MPSFAFLGSHPLGDACLRHLTAHEDTEIAVAVTYAEGHDHWWEGSVYRTARELGHDVLTIDDERALLDVQFDWLLSVYYPNILSEELLAQPREGALNLHQAELPRYRGSNVFSHSIMNARDDDHWKHGTTLHFMAPEVDAGDIVARKFAPITEDDTARALYEKVREQSVKLFEEQLPHIVDGSVYDQRRPQSEFEGKRYFYRKDSLDGRKAVDPQTLADGGDALYDRIRALDFPPHEPAWTEVAGHRLYLTADGYERHWQG